MNMSNSTQPASDELIKQISGLNLLVQSDASLMTPEFINNINNLAGNIY